MYKSFSMELGGRTLTVDIGRVAAQANGAAFMHYGDTTVLSTATASDKPRDGIDSVSYTHLDVYKRQPEYQGRSFRDSGCTGSGAFERGSEGGVKAF